MAVPKVICPICGESTTHRPGSGPVVACPRCGSSFGEHEAVLVDSEWTARIYSELSTLTAPLPPVRSDARGLPDVPGYEVLAFVARGGMGIVLKARQVALRRLVALKMPLPHEGMSEEARERFLREARSAADLRHPNICPVYEVGDHEGRPYIAMAFIEGETLRDWAKRQRPSPHRAAQMVAVVARAVQHAHEHGVIHRDIKPGNIMVEGETEQPVLTDFGLAKVVSEDAPGLTVTLSGQVIGTPAYMAPEQAAGRTHEIGPRTDVYALGAVLYDLLCDRPPFLGTAMEILTHVQTAEPVPPRKQKPGIQRDLETICLKALAREAAGRYESALALAEDLDRFCAGESILARPEGLASKLARKARGNPIGAVGLTVALLAVIALVGFALAARRTRRIAAFTHAFDSQLEAGDWSAAHVEELDALARDLARLSPERGAAAHERLTQRLAASIRERIRQPVVLPDDAARIRSAIGVLAARSSDLAPPLGQALEERLRLWQTLFDLSPPFHDVETVFGRGQVQIDGGAMLSRASDARADPVVLTAVRCEGNIQLEASFSGSWQAAYKVGLLLNASAGNRGYTVLLRVPRPEPPAAPAAAAPPERLSFAAARASGGTLSLQLLRHGVLLRSKELAASQLAPGPLRLLVSREADRLTFQVNDLVPVVFEDVLPISGKEVGVFGVFWPAEARVERLSGARQALPVALSPLERGDELYGRDRFAEALAFYREQAITTAEAEFRQEARYKEGLCLVGLHRDEESGKVFGTLAGGTGRRWPMLGACQLWLLRLRQQQLTEADDIFESLSTRFRFEQLAALMPEDLRRGIMDLYARAGSGTGFFQFSPTRVRDLERAVAIGSLLDPNADYHNMSRRSLLRAYRMAGELAKAQALAEEFVRQGFPRWSGGVMEEYGWILRERGQPQRALEEVNRRLLDPSGGYSPSFWWTLVERARCRIALGQWDDAEKDVGEFLRMASEEKTIADYYVYSAAWLIRGFLRERRGDAPGALEAWRSGFLKSTPGSARTSFLDDVHGAGAACHFLILGSLTHELTDAEVDQLFGTFATAALANTPLAGPAQGLRLPATAHAAFREMWRGPRGRDFARKIAFQQLPYADFVRAPAWLFFTEFARQEAFGGSLAAEQEAVVWQLIQDGVGAYMAGKVGMAQAAQVLLTWRGVTGVLGWGGLAPTLEPRLRGPGAYVLGHRCLRLGRPQDAASFFRTALADAPPDSPLRRLAQAELDRLKGSP